MTTDSARKDPAKLYGALSLARRAGALVAGFDEVARAARGGRAALVLLAADASDGTQRRVHTACAGACPVLKTDLGQDDIATITRKPVAVLAVTDTNLAVLARRYCPGPPDEEEPV